MPATEITPRLLSWGSDVDDGTIGQALKASRLPVVAGHVALMPDAHVGIGATIGSVIPTEGAIIPSAVGVDIGCGMAAVHLDVRDDQLPDDLTPLLGRIERVVPAGVGQGTAGGSDAAGRWLAANRPPAQLSDREAKKAHEQFGSLGAGNHFFELCVDEAGGVWVLLHSGSRGIGNLLAQRHIAKARGMAKAMGQGLEDPDLAWFTQGTPAFDAYVADMLWAQDYAKANRDRMLDRSLRVVKDFLGIGRELERVNCHHNFAALEEHDGRSLWITRKGAIEAGDGQLGLIPGSMGTRSYVVRGTGNPASWRSCSHGAGRRLSRTAAKKRYTAADLTEQMGGRVWLRSRARSLVDEIPSAYKDIDQVMADQRDLVDVVHTLRQVLNYKGT